MQVAAPALEGYNHQQKALFERERKESVESVTPRARGGGRGVHNRDVLLTCHVGSCGINDIKFPISFPINFQLYFAVKIEFCCKLATHDESRDDKEEDKLNPRLKQYTASYENKVFRKLEDEPPPAASVSSAYSAQTKRRESPPAEGGKLLVLGGDIDWSRPTGAYIPPGGSGFVH